MPNIITIDGPTSSGKSSVGHLFSQKIGYQFIDTGAIYRIGCMMILENNIDVSNEDDCAQVFESLDVSFKSLNGESLVFIDGKEITDVLHSPEITKIVPTVAAYPKVRSKAKKTQHRLGMGADTVMAGRDIGSEIFPDAPLKFFITADVEVRAKRRYHQIKQKNPEVKFENVLNGMIKRDKTDSEREASPMRIPEGAVIIDTTQMSTEESVSKMLEEYKKRFLEV